MIEVEDFLAHYGKKGMKWGVRNDDTVSSGGVGESTKKLSRREVKKINKVNKEAYDGGKASEVYLESKGKGERVLVKSRALGDFADTVMTGKQFVDYVEKGGAIDISSTRIFARQAKEGEAFVLNNFEDEVYRPIKR